MFMAPIEPPRKAAPRRQYYLVVRLLRRWAAGREAGEPQLPSLVRFAQELGVEAQSAVAVASLFQLTESCLGRPLQTECCCSRRLSSDEQAVVLMLDTAAARIPFTNDTIPHGLPGALMWAIASVRQLIGKSDHPKSASQHHCPFSLT